MASPLKVEAFEAVVLELRLNTGIYRTTFRGRFGSVDPLINRLLADRFQPGTNLQVHDWAASDCLTSAEWAATLFEAFPNATLTASDLTLFLLEIDLKDGTAFVMERGGELLQYISPPFVVDLNPPRPDTRVLARFLARRARERMAEIRPRLHIPAEWLDANESPETELDLPPFVVRKLSVIHPDAEDLRARNARFRIRSHSVFDPLEEPVDLIRSMNIYNLSYFAPERLLEGARAVWRSLRTGGWWATGRTSSEDPPEGNISILEKTEAGFRLVDRCGTGSEIESLVLGSQGLYTT